LGVSIAYTLNIKYVSPVGDQEIQFKDKGIFLIEP